MNIINLFKNNSLLKTSLSYVMATVIVKGLNFLTTPIFTRVMSPSDFGIVSNFTVWAQLLAIVICGQIMSGLIAARYSIAESRFDNYVASIVRGALVLGIAISIVVVFFSSKLELLTSVKKIYIPCLCVYAFGICMGDLFSNYCIVMNLVNLKILYSIVSSILNILLGVFCVKLFASGAHGRIVGYTVTYGMISFFSTFYFLKKPCDQFEIVHKDIRFALLFGIPLIPHLMANLVNGNIDRVFIIRYLNESEAGIYSVAYTIGVIAFVVADACNDAWIPWFAEKNKKKEYGIITKTIKLYSITLAMCFLGIMMFAPELILIMSGKDYWSGVYCIRYIAVGIFFMFMYRFSVNYEQLNGRSIYIAPATIVAALINIILNIIFIPVYGIIGAALATSISYFALWIFHEYIARKIISGYDVKIQSYVPACVIILFAFFISEPLFTHFLVRLFIVVIACGIYSIYALKILKNHF